MFDFHCQHSSSFLHCKGTAPAVPRKKAKTKIGDKNKKKKGTFRGSDNKQVL